MRVTLATVALFSLLVIASSSPAAEETRFKVTVSGTQTDVIEDTGESFGSCAYTTASSAKATYSFTTVRPATITLGSELPSEVKILVKAAGSLNRTETLKPGSDADCLPIFTVKEKCSANKKSFLNAGFTEGGSVSIGRGEQDLLLKKCEEWGRFSGLGGLIFKKVSARQLRNQKVTVVSGKATETRLIHGYGDLKTTFRVTAKLTRIDG